jgi:hypothetical protein
MMLNIFILTLSVPPEEKKLNIRYHVEQLHHFCRRQLPRAHPTPRSKDRSHRTQAHLPGSDAVFFTDSGFGV